MSFVVSPLEWTAIGRYTEITDLVAVPALVQLPGIQVLRKLACPLKPTPENVGFFVSEMMHRNPFRVKRLPIFGAKENYRVRDNFH